MTDLSSSPAPTGNPVPAIRSNNGRNGARRISQPRERASLAATGALIAAAVVGAVMNLQSASLLAGMGIIWAGMAVLVSCAGLAWFFPTSRTLRVVLILAAIGSVWSATAMQHHLHQLALNLQLS